MAAAEESAEEIISYLQGSNMVFITAGMGGGTGTGAAPVVARLAKELGILTVGVVTKPFHFEGVHRMKTAEKGILELQKYVDTLIVIPNQNLFRIANERTTFADAFKMADDVLHHGVRSVTDLMIMPGLINLDFADVKSVMSEMGKAMMGTGEATGENRAVEAAESAIANPLLEHHSMRGAKGVLINITGGPDMTLFEVDAAANRIRQEVGDGEANIIFGSTFNPALEGIMRVSVVATGIDAEAVMSIRSSQMIETPNLNSDSEEELLKNEEAIEEQQEVEVGQAVSSERYEENTEMNQPPKFNEYNMPGSTTYHKAPKASQEETGPLALLRRMWGFTKPTTPSPQSSYKQAPVQETHPKEMQYQTQENQTGEVYDIPAFLRRRK